MKKTQNQKELMQNYHYLQNIAMHQKVYDDLTENIADFLEGAIDVDKIAINGEFAGFRVYFNYNLARVTIDTERGVILCRASGYADDIGYLDDKTISQINQYFGE